MNIGKKGNFILFVIVVFIIGAVAGSGATFGYFRLANNAVMVDRDYLDKVTVIAERFAKLNYFYEMIDKQYYGEYTTEGLMEGAYNGMFGTLDKYSTYLNAEDYKLTTDAGTSTFSGVGVYTAANDNNEIEIMDIIEGSPAEKAGLKPGDILIAVDDVKYSGDQLDEAVAAMRGEKGTRVILTYTRQGIEKSSMLIRNTIKEDTISWAIYSSDDENGYQIGYLRILSFGSGTGDEFAKIVRDMELKGVDGLLIDLRNNGGGVVEAAVSIADQLLPEATIMTTKSRSGGETYNSDASCLKVPYVLMVNQNTASSSEILTAAIQGNKAGEIVGVNTLGKGVVQMVGNIKGEQDGFKLTFEEYFGPNDMKINGIGIKPDYEVEQDFTSDVDTQAEVAIKLLFEKLDESTENN